jgi:cyanophycinase
MPETMLIGGQGDSSPGNVHLAMAAGLGFISGVTIDSHFAQRGRIGRLLGAVAQNPVNLGIGIDEDTAIVVSKDQRVRVIGDGAVYIVDGTGITYSSLSEKNVKGVITICDVKLHVLGQNQQFDLLSRRPAIASEATDT